MNRLMRGGLVLLLRAASAFLFLISCEQMAHADPVTAITGGVGLVGSLAGGLLSKSAASKAAAIQQQAANEQAAKITQTVNDVNPQIGHAATTAGEMVSGATGNAADSVIRAAGDAGRGVTQASVDANKLLNPYSEAGAASADAIKKGLADGGEFNRTPTLKDIQIDPGFAFRQQQAQQQMDRSAAARGGVLSGSAIKDAISYNSGAASQEYQNAYNRFTQSTKDRFDRQFAEQGVGMTAAGKQGDNTIGAARYTGDIGFQGEKTAGDYRVGGAQYVGDTGIHSAETQAANSINGASKSADLITGGAAAKAAGIVGGTNALVGGINGGINAATGAVNNYNLMNLLKNPATVTGAMPPGYKPPDVNAILKNAGAFGTLRGAT